MDRLLFTERKTRLARHFRLDCSPNVHRNYFSHYFMQYGLHHPAAHVAERVGIDLLFLHYWIFDSGGSA